MAGDPNADYFDSYGDPGVHRTMLADRIRTDAFRRALERCVEPGSVVLDVGAGSSILSLFAARAGASRVHAVEASPIAEVAERIISANGQADVIQLHECLVEDLELPEGVDVIVSEWLGYFALGEAMFESVLVARNAFLREGGVMIPSHVQMFLAPVQDGSLAYTDGLSMWTQQLWGFDFAPMLDHELGELCSTTPGIDPSSLIGPPQLLMDVDCAEADQEEFWFDTHVEMPIERDGWLHGLAGWFDALLAPGVMLSTAPDAPKTHWRQAWFPMRPIEVRAGDVLWMRMRALPREEHDRRLPVYLGDGSLQRGGEEVYTFFHRWYASLD